MVCYRHAGVEWKEYFDTMLKQYDRDGSLDIVKSSLDTLALLPWTINPEVDAHFKISFSF